MSFVASGIGLAGWLGIGSAVVGAGTQIYGATQANKAAKAAVSQQKGIIQDIKYEPIDIEALKKEATQAAIDNATRSLAIERDINPDVAAARSELARQVSSELALGGNLSPDVVNRVNTAGRVIGGTSGGGNNVPLTASLLGLTSMDLANQRRAAAGALVAQNDLPLAGLDPGAVASLQVAQNNAQNDFNLAKTGAELNLTESEQKARTAQIGGQVGMISSLSNLLGKGAGAYVDSRSGIGEKTTYDKFFGIKGSSSTGGDTTLGDSTSTGGYVGPGNDLSIWGSVPTAEKNKLLERGQTKDLNGMSEADRKRLIQLLGGQ